MKPRTILRSSTKLAQPVPPGAREYFVFGFYVHAYGRKPTRPEVIAAPDVTPAPEIPPPPPPVIPVEPPSAVLAQRGRALATRGRREPEVGRIASVLKQVNLV